MHLAPLSEPPQRLCQWLCIPWRPLRLHCLLDPLLDLKPKSRECTGKQDFLQGQEVTKSKSNRSDVHHRSPSSFEP